MNDIFKRIFLPVVFGTILFSGCERTVETISDIDLTLVPDSLELFAEHRISTSLYERDMAIAPNGKEFIYTLGTYDQRKRGLVVTEQKESVWSEAALLPFSGRYQDIEPFYSPDGNTLFFASNRPIYGDASRSDYNIWYVNRSQGNWSEPIPLDSLINTPKDEFYPAVTANGTLYFTATRKDGLGREDIYRSKKNSGNYEAPVALDSTINSLAYEFNAYVDPEETLIIFSSFGRADGLGGGDLYFSKKTADGHWSKSMNMGPAINSEYLDYCPFVDLHTGNFYFTSERVKGDSTKINTPADIENLALSTLNGMGNIYRIGLKNTPLKQLP
ncbi:TolB family protein [Muriicola sp.]|uniref:TolB family protein n=1 Tax=Muriicola sp. TaxID=2020856 RepID=UPI003C73FA91